MKVHIVKLSLPGSWSNVDVVLAINRGLQDYYHANRTASYKTLRPVLEQPVRGAVHVLAVIPTHGEQPQLREER